jgi:hypothetical protein
MGHFVNLEFLSFDFIITDVEIWKEVAICLRSLTNLRFLYLLFSINQIKHYEKFNDEVADHFIQNISTTHLNFISLRGSFSNEILLSFKQHLHKFKYLTEFNIKGSLKLNSYGVELIDYILENTYFIANILLDVEYIGNQEQVDDCKEKIGELELKYNRTFSINHVN